MSDKTATERVHELLYSCEDREELAERIARLEGENAKLRELVRDMARELALKYAEGTGALPDESWSWYDRMLELGRDDVFTCEDVEGAFVSGYSLGSLPVGSDPVWNENEQTAAQSRPSLEGVTGVTEMERRTELDLAALRVAWQCLARPTTCDGCEAERLGVATCEAGWATVGEHVDAIRAALAGR